MACTRMPFYVPHSKRGIISAVNLTDGYAIAINWTRAYPDSTGFDIAYNIYYSTSYSDVYSEGVKSVILDPNLNTEIIDLLPGENYYFAVRASEYETDLVNISSLPMTGDSYYYPEAVLSQDFLEDDDTIFVTDIELFPNSGLLKIGNELIYYANINLINNSFTNLIRGYYGTEVRLHTIDGYDGFDIFENPSVIFHHGFEDDNTTIIEETCAFEWKSWPYTVIDGYREITQDLLTSGLVDNLDNSGTFPIYDTAGWRRTNIADMLAGNCIDSYYGGERGCANVPGGQVRGTGANDESNAREEFLLEITGKEVTLVQRNWTGVRCKCVQSTSEFPEQRCPYCFGSGIVVGYQQFFNPRRSDGKILMRFDPTDDDLILNDEGLESTFSANAWTLTYPIIKDWDIIIRYAPDGSEEFRYEVTSVSRNQLLGEVYGAQKLKLRRLRKTDQLYTIPIFANSATMPSLLTTSIGFYNGIPHTHTLVISENISSINQINQLTSVSLGHNHSVINGIVQNYISNSTGNGLHSHEIILT